MERIVFLTSGPGTATVNTEYFARVEFSRNRSHKKQEIS